MMMMMYGTGELAEIARVPRQLVLRHDDRTNSEAWIPGVPRDFSGYVCVSKPEYLIEVQPRPSLEGGEEDDDDEDEINSFLVSIDTEITVVACEVQPIAYDRLDSPLDSCGFSYLIV